MTARPVVPRFVAQDSSLTNLQLLSASVAFLGTSAVGWRLQKNGNQSLTAGVTAQITFGNKPFDPDGVLSSGAASINTQGYYDCECTLPFSNTGTAGATARLWFQVTTGSNNPLGSGVSLQFGRLSDLTTGSNDEMSLSIKGTSPCLYVNDTVQVQANIGASNVTVSASWNNSGNNDLAGFPDGGAQFTGILISEGP